jgi:hypothetical protein
MPKLALLVAPSGAMLLSLRHGPVPPGRRMFEVSSTETIELAQRSGLVLTRECHHQESLLGRPGVSWTRLAFSGPA